jgi:uncharacterized membrane protein
MDTPLSELIVSVAFIGLAALLIASVDKEKAIVISRRERWMLVVLIVLYMLAVNASLYLYYAPVGYKIIYGMQGRYYLPILPLAILLLQSKRVIIEDQLYKRIAIILPVVLLLCSVLTIYARYFIHTV